MCAAEEAERERAIADKRREREQSATVDAVRRMHADPRAIRITPGQRAHITRRAR